MRIAIVTILFLCSLPSVGGAAGSDYSVALEEVSASFVETSGSAQLKVSIMHAKRRANRVVARRKRKKKVSVEVTLPEGTTYTRLPKRCRRITENPNGVVVLCRLGKVRRNRSKSKTFTLRFSTGCESTINVLAKVVRKSSSPDSKPENDTTSLSIDTHCTLPPESSGCSSLSTESGAVHQVSNVSELRSAVSAANSSGNATILLADGIYVFDQGVQVTGSGITIRSASGDRSAVVVKGQGMSGKTTHLFWISGDDVTIADMTLRDVANHAVQIHGELDADRPLLHNLHVLDTREQMIKGSYAGGESGNSSEAGVIQCSRFEFSAGEGIQNYTGGIDVHYGKNWVVRDNVFLNIKSPDSTLAEHAIHFWSDSSGTTVERNTIVSCDRGVGFGLGDRGHSGGVVRNNFIYHDSSAGDVGIGLENASDVEVYHNTILFENGYPNAIEYRFENTSAVIINNLTNAGITARNGGTASLKGNLLTAEKGWFVAPEDGDLHLNATGISGAGDRGEPLAGIVSEDFDSQSRSELTPDVGADEGRGS